MVYIRTLLSFHKAVRNICLEKIAVFNQKIFQSSLHKYSLPAENHAFSCWCFSVKVLPHFY